MVGLIPVGGALDFVLAPLVAPESGVLGFAGPPDFARVGRGISSVGSGRGYSDVRELADSVVDYFERASIAGSRAGGFGGTVIVGLWVVDFGGVTFAGLDKGHFGEFPFAARLVGPYVGLDLSVGAYLCSSCSVGAVGAYLDCLRFV